LPTCDWIREDGLEAFYESTEHFGDPGLSSGPASLCPVCMISYESGYGLQSNISAEHKVERPVLLKRVNSTAQMMIIRMELAKDFLRKPDGITQRGEDD